MASIKLSTEEFIQIANRVHNKYDYSKSEYLRYNYPTTIICKIHGEFLQQPSLHLKGHGCPKCSSKIRSDKYRKTTEQFIEESVKVHGLDIYDYSKSRYISGNKKLIITCTKHGEFTQEAAVHLSGSGCPKCGRYISKKETQWLDSLNISEKYRQKLLYIDQCKIKADAFDPNTNTVYEFWGDYWHGNPIRYNLDEINIFNKKSFRELYENTQEKRKLILNANYNLVEIWETSFDIKIAMKELKEYLLMKITPENTARLKQLVADGIQVLQECEDLKAGLSDTVKAIAEEFEIKPSIINKMIKDVQKNKIGDRKEENEIMEELLKIAGLN